MDTDLLDAARSQERRRIVRSLRDDSPLEFETLADIVTSDPNDRTRAPIRLRHVHLPHLEDVGVVVRDGEARTIGRGRRFDEMERLVSVLERELGEVRPRG